MRKIHEVEQAKALMNEAMDWSVMRWLREKKRVRKAADQANAALDEQNRVVKEHWSHELRAAYRNLIPPKAVWEKFTPSNRRSVPVPENSCEK